MAEITVAPKLNVHVTFVIDESEARALDALAGYGDDAFVKAFYEQLGEAYMRQHEDGLRKFLSSIRGVVNPALVNVDKARQVLKSNKNKNSV